MHLHMLVYMRMLTYICVIAGAAAFMNHHCLVPWWPARVNSIPGLSPSGPVTHVLQEPGAQQTEGASSSRLEEAGQLHRLVSCPPVTSCSM
jgi:hypothetical protein